MSKPYVVRDWLACEVFEFDSYPEASDKFEQLLADIGKDAECDIQLLHVLEEVNNVD